MSQRTLVPVLVLASVLVLVLLTGSAGAPPEGQLTWAVHVSRAPAWFDPAETAGITGHPYSAPYEDLRLKGK